MNKKPISYLQTDKRWKDKGWNGMTIGPSGCGPTAAAMLISTLTGKEVTPEETFSWAGTHGHLEKGHGTNYTTYFQKQFAEYGLRAEMLNWQNTYGKPNHPNHEKVVEQLKEGYYAIALMNKGLWTSSGHFVVVWWSDDKVRINDPASTRAERLNGDIRTFRSEVKYYWLIDARDYNKKEETPVNNAVYKTLKDVPDDYRPTIQKLMEKKVLGGFSDPDPTRLDDNILNISEDFCRVMVVLDRLGVLDK